MHLSDYLTFLNCTLGIYLDNLKNRPIIKIDGGKNNFHRFFYESINHNYTQLVDLIEMQKKRESLSFKMGVFLFLLSQTLTRCINNHQSKHSW